MEKLEDMVQIIFLPLVSHICAQPYVPSTCLVLHDFRAEHEFGIDQYRYVLFARLVGLLLKSYPLSGTAWGFVFAIAILDFSGKFTGCTLSSKALGFTWREATTVGSLMSCKGYVSFKQSLFMSHCCIVW